MFESLYFGFSSWFVNLLWHIFYHQTLLYLFLPHHSIKYFAIFLMPCGPLQCTCSSANANLFLILILLKSGTFLAILPCKWYSTNRLRRVHTCMGGYYSFLMALASLNGSPFESLTICLSICSVVLRFPPRFTLLLWGFRAFLTIFFQHCTILKISRCVCPSSWSARIILLFSGVQCTRRPISFINFSAKLNNLF